jgi:isopentenyl diphosphate isomerase/L-lactate dehydrogenase-like FMN-dependent dehydrogenase
VRRGTDIATALAFGAQAVFIGRPIIYALAYDGAAGVRLALDLLGQELRNVMALLGTPTLRDITRAHVV